MDDISCSLVVFDNHPSLAEKAINSFLDTQLRVKLFLIDNSQDGIFKTLLKDKRVEYISNHGNIGFGAGHNIGLKKSVGNFKYHLVLNPDVYFHKGTIEKIFDFMEKNPNVGSLMPKVLYFDGSLQYLCRLLPTPVDLFLRKLDKLISGNFINLLSKYELKGADYNQIMDVPYLSGCFMFIRTEVFEKVDIFDERFFIYFEDIDLSRRIHRLYRTIYFPEVFIYHGYKRGSSEGALLLKYLVLSGIKYFNKWGWFFDRERNRINRETLRNIFSDLKN